MQEKGFEPYFAGEYPTFTPVNNLEESTNHLFS